jgi:hypothetical protein
LFPITGYGFLRARSWSHYFFIGINLASAIFSLFGSLPDAIGALLWSGGVTYYLFWWPTVRDYFRAPEASNT